MNANQETDDFKVISEEAESDDALAVDDFIRQLEAKEKDLHITADTTIIEIEQAFDDGNPPNFLKEGFSIVKPAVEQDDCPDREEAAAKAVQFESIELESEVEELREKIDRLEEERDEMMASSQRRARDFENFRIRAERDRLEHFQNQTCDLAAQLIPVIDNLQRALDFAAKNPNGGGGEFRRFFDGIMLVNKQIGEIFSSMGIESILAVGKKFDPHLHEAAVTEQTSDYPPNTVCAELLRGYRMGDRIIRHSMVKVAVAPRQPAGDADSSPSQSGWEVEPLSETEDFLDESSSSSPDDPQSGLE